MIKSKKPLIPPAIQLGNTGRTSPGHTDTSILKFDDTTSIQPKTLQPTIVRHVDPSALVRRQKTIDKLKNRDYSLKVCLAHENKNARLWCNCDCKCIYCKTIENSIENTVDQWILESTPVPPKKWWHKWRFW